MQPAQLRSRHAMGKELGGHTVTHPILAKLEAREAQAEIARGKQQIEDIVGAPVDVFAYPNGVPD